MSDLVPTKLTEREHLEAAREATAARKAELERELEQADRWLDWLDQGIQIAEGSANGAPPALPPAEDDPPPVEPEPEKPAATPKRAAPAARHTGSRRKQTEDPEFEALLQRVHEVIKADGPVSRKQIVTACGLTESEFKRVMVKLRNKGVSQIGNRGGAKYVAKHGSITPRSGPKTDAERRVFDALAERPLTAAGISVKIGRPQPEVSSMAEAMARRRVLDRLDTDDPPVRYAQAGGPAE